MTQERVISIFGANDAAVGSQPYETARAVGRALAELGYTIANGGYGGTMAASARGAREGGGKTIGVTCDVWSSSPNEYIDRVVRTDSYRSRLERLIELATSGYVALPGATGTLVELALVWELACKDWSREATAARPIVCVGEFWQPLLKIITAQKPAAGQFVKLVRSPAELSRHFPVQKDVDRSP